MSARVRSTAKAKTAAALPDPPPVAAAAIEVRGARQNNLRGIDVDIPLGQITVVTGPSGSGKSSLAFDTIYAEGQRRYVETFSPYVRQFFERMDKPQVDDIRGIPPAIAIEQSNAVRTTRSTVGTMTEINDYLKLLFPRLAEASCPSCGQPVRPDTPPAAARQAATALAGRDVLVVFPVPVPAKTAPADFFAFLQQQGFLRVRLYGQLYRTDEPASFARTALPGVVEVVQDRVKLPARGGGVPPTAGSTSTAEGASSFKTPPRVIPEKTSSPVAAAVSGGRNAPATPPRLQEALEAAFHYGKGQARVLSADDGPPVTLDFSRGWHCPACDVALREPTPALFSFNNPLGACPECRGFGRVIGIDLDRALPDKSLSIRGGLVRAFQGSVMAESQRDLLKAAKARGVDVDCPYDELPEADQRWVIEGDRPDPEDAWKHGEWYGVRGFFKWCESRLYKMHIRVFLSRYRAYTTCAVCGGGRLQPEALNFRVRGATLPDWWRMPVARLKDVVADLRPLIAPGDGTGEMLRAEVENRLHYLDRVGLGYLTLDRATRTLSGGEVERVNLTSCLGASLVNTLFVMDEPSVGLHPRDVNRMIDVMRDLRDKGNTLLVVEHEESVIRAADHLLDIGPGRGQHGGELVYAGPVAQKGGRASRLPASSEKNLASGTSAPPSLASPPTVAYFFSDDSLHSGTSRDAGRALAELGARARDEAGKTSAATAEERLRCETESLVAWAKENGWFLTEKAFRRALPRVEYVAGGNEHEVWAWPEAGRVLKMTRPPNFGARGALAAYLGNLLWSNELFADDIRLEAVVETTLGVALVVSQPFIVGREATEAEIADFFTARGFDAAGENTWKHAATGLRIADARPANVLTDEEGALFAIDVQILGTPSLLPGDDLEARAGGTPAFPSGAASLTLAYLLGEKSIPVPARRRAPRPGYALKLKAASQHNLRKLDVTIPLGLFVGITGVSGSGKSTLIHDVLYENLLRAKGRSSENEPGHLRALTGVEFIDEVVMVDQSPLSRTPRSTPAVYVGAWEAIRAQFAATPEAKAEGLTPSYFSFNSGTGRCQRCLGAGAEKVEMQFLSDLFVTCPACDGTRFTAAAREYKLHGKAVHEVLDLTVSEALVFLAGKAPAALARLRLLEEVGLGYLRLGQPLNTLSGGESQRLKLVAHLAERGGGVPSTAEAAARQGEGASSEGAARRKAPLRASRADSPGRALRGGRDAPATSLLIFDEPTTGLHFDDIALLLQVFHRLVDAGHNLLVIEHNLEVIKNADWLLDLGPEAGEDGGRLVAEGPPEAVAAVAGSHTGRFLRGVLAGFDNPTDQSNLSDASDSSGRRPPAPATHTIGIHGAREHNLKNLSLEIPRDQFVVITGLSGSGKSTLAFDILFAEGQRRFLDSMSPYARQFAEQLERPDVDHLTGLPPTVAIEQRLTRGGGKSTVATVTEVYHFLRLLYAKVGTQHCPKCDVPVTQKTPAEIATEVAALAKKGAIKLLATVIKGRKGFHTEVAEWTQRQGFTELRVDGQFVPVAGFKKLARFREHTIEVVVENFARGTHPARVVQAAVERALEVGKGALLVLDATRRVRVFSREMTCPGCGQAFEPLDPRLFSFNSPHGWCPECRGFGTVPDRRLEAPERSDESMLEAELRDEMRAADDEEDGRPPVMCPACDGTRLNPVARAVRVQDVGLGELAALGVGELKAIIDTMTFTGRDAVIARDIMVEIAQRLHFMEKVGLGYLQLGRAARTLSGGESQRIRLAAQLGSNLRGVLYILDEPTIGLHPRDNVRLLDTLIALRDKGNSVIVVEHDDDTMRRADRIYDLGPGAGQFGGELVAQGTLAEVMATPGSPTGQAMHAPMKHPLRGARRPVETPSSGSPPPAKKRAAKKASPVAEAADPTRWLTLTGCRANNLRDLTVAIPLQRLTVFTGISGSGKSSLLRGVIHPAVQAALAGGRAKKRAGLTPAWDRLTGAEGLEAVHVVDQSPIGKTSRSTPATYIGVFDDIRKLFAAVPEARMRGYTASRFSFNVEGGRCEACKGNGQVKLEMAFLPASYLPCEECHGMRYNAATLEVEYNGKTIGQVMKLTIDEAADFFAAVPSIARTLRLLAETGVGYLQLGQPSPTLSGGEAQRIKLVTELTKGLGRSERARLRQNRTPKGSLYLIEEPTIGLHLQDVEKLIGVLHRLVDDGHTVIVIEHNLDVIAEADWLLDLGPEAGDAGGTLVAHGPPEHVARSAESRTAPFLRAVLEGAAARR